MHWKDLEFIKTALQWTWEAGAPKSAHDVHEWTEAFHHVMKHPKFHKEIVEWLYTDSHSRMVVCQCFADFAREKCSKNGKRKLSKRDMADTVCVEEKKLVEVMTWDDDVGEHVALKNQVS